MRSWFLFLAFFLFLSTAAQAQELNATVKVNFLKVENVDPTVFTTLEQAIAEFMNNTNWTNDFFETAERINCNILLTIQEELSPTSFRAELAVQASRPVYGSNYQTTLLNHNDPEVTFTYEQYQPLIFSRNSFNDNLSAVLSFYAYIILGLDYDSFSLFGGEAYFQTAQEIINNVPSSAANAFKGWRSIDGNRNRFWIVENLLSPRVRPLRQGWYEYHRHGLDMMSENPAAGRAVIAQALATLPEMNQTYPNTMILQMFNNAKRDEIIEVFKGAPAGEKSQLIQVMTQIDPPNAQAYRGIR